MCFMSPITPKIPEAVQYKHALTSSSNSKEAACLYRANQIALIKPDHNSLCPYVC